MMLIVAGITGFMAALLIGYVLDQVELDQIELYDPESQLRKLMHLNQERCVRRIERRTALVFFAIFLYCNATLLFVLSPQGTLIIHDHNLITVVLYNGVLFCVTFLLSFVFSFFWRGVYESRHS